MIVSKLDLPTLNNNQQHKFQVFSSIMVIFFARNVSLDLVGSFLDFRAILLPKVSYEFLILSMATVNVVNQPFTRS